MDRSEGEAGPNLVFEAGEPQPHPFAEAQIDACTRSNHEVVSRSVAVGKIEAPASGQQFYVGHKALGTKRPAGAGEEGRLTLGKVRVGHAADFGLDAISPIEIRIDVNTCAGNCAA